MNFCNELARSLGQTAPPALWHDTDEGMLAAIEATIRPGDGERVRLYQSDACLVLLQLRGQLRMTVHVDDFEFRATPFHAGTVFVFDLRRSVELDFVEPCHTLALHVPRAHLTRAAMQSGVTASVRPPQSGLQDTTLSHLGMSIRESLHDPFAGDSALHGQMFHSFLLRLTTSLATPSARGRPPRRALSPREADALLSVVSKRLTRGLSVAEAAQACGLTHPTFERAFRQSVGIAPNQWLILRRLDVAMERMLDSDQSLAEIAVESGFADQSHFTHAFSRRLGTSPAAWRRMNASRMAVPA